MPLSFYVIVGNLTLNASGRNFFLLFNACFLFCIFPRTVICFEVCRTIGYINKLLEGGIMEVNQLYISSIGSFSCGDNKQEKYG